MIEEGKQLKSILIKSLKYFIIIFFSLQIIRGEDSLDVELNLDSLWENYEWEEIQEVTDVYAEVEQITAVAGVRGSEAKYEILKYLYYRKSMRKNNKKRK